MNKLSLFLFISLCSFSLVLVSCADVKKPEQLEKIAKMMATIDSIELVVAENDLDSGIIFHNSAESIERKNKKELLYRHGRS